MSASTVPVPPEASPDAPRLTPPARLQPGPRAKLWPVLIFVLVFAAAAVWLFVGHERASPAQLHTARTVRAQRGSIESTVRVSGSITAERYSLITAPILQAPDAGRGLVLIYLAEPGSFVREGEVVAKLDNRLIVDHLDDVEDQLVQIGFDLRSRQAQMQAEMEALRQRLRAARAAYDQAMLDLPLTAVRPTVIGEQLKLNAAETRAVYEELRGELELVRQRQEAQMRIYQLNYERQLRHRNRHRDDMIHCEIKAPISGQVVIQTLHRHGGEQNQIRNGDQLAPRQPFMKIIDAKSMLLEATMSQTESDLLRIGQRARIRFDAFPDLVVSGRVQAVGALAVSGRRVNYYVRSVPLRLEIQDRDDRILPDLTASADVVVADDEPGVIVPREAIVEHEGKPLVFVKQAEGFEPREIEIGGYNSTHAAVVAGLTGGEEVSLEPRAN